MEHVVFTTLGKELAHVDFARIDVHRPILEHRMIDAWNLLNIEAARGFLFRLVLRVLLDIVHRQCLEIDAVLRIGGILELRAAKLGE